MGSIHISVMPLAGKLGGQAHPDFGFRLTLFQPGEGGGADYAHHFTICPPGFENLTTSLCIWYSHFYMISVLCTLNDLISVPWSLEFLNLQ
jgi:hypothetical protein